MRPGPRGGSLGRTIRAMSADEDLAALHGAGDLSGMPAAVLRGMVDRAPAGIILTGSDGRYLYASPGAAEVMGHAPRPIPGSTKHELFEPTVAARLAAMERRLMEHGGR